MKNKILNYYFTLIGKLANRYLNRVKAEVIGVTGSVGKTSSRSIIHTILQNYLEGKTVYSSPKNFNGKFGLTLSIFKIEKYTPNVMNMVFVLFIILFRSFFRGKKYDIIILEYGIDEIGEMDFLLNIIKPNFSVFTKIDKVHCLNFGSPDVTAKEKFKLIFNTKEVAFINYDDSYGRSGFEQISIDKFYYSTKPENADIDIDFQNSNITNEDGQYYSKFNLKIKNKYFYITTNLLSKESYGYIGVGLMLLDILSNKLNGNSFFQSFQGSDLKINFSLQPGRMNLFQGINNSVLIDSTYNCAPESLNRMINNTYKLQKEIFIDYKIILFIGDMRELGEFTEQEHRKMAGVISQVADLVYLIGPSSSTFTQDELIKIGFDGKNIKAFLSSIQGGQDLKLNIMNSSNKYLILFKGSQNTIFIEEGLKQNLSNQNDAKLLPRQSKDWLKKKDNFFKSLNK